MFMSMDKRSYASIRLFIKDLSGNVRHKRAEGEQIVWKFSWDKKENKKNIHKSQKETL